MAEQKVATHRCPRCGRGAFSYLGNRGFLKRGDRWRCVYDNSISETDEFGNLLPFKD